MVYHPGLTKYFSLGGTHQVLGSNVYSGISREVRLTFRWQHILKNMVLWTCWKKTLSFSRNVFHSFSSVKKVNWLLTFDRACLIDPKKIRRLSPVALRRQIIIGDLAELFGCVPGQQPWTDGGIQQQPPKMQKGFWLLFPGFFVADWQIWFMSVVSHLSNFRGLLWNYPNLSNRLGIIIIHGVGILYRTQSDQYRRPVNHPGDPRQKCR